MSTLEISPVENWGSQLLEASESKGRLCAPELAPQGELLGCTPVPTSHQLRAFLAGGTDFQQLLTICQ